MGLSVSGHARAAAADGVSRILYLVEHLTLLEDVQQQVVHPLTSRPVDFGQVGLCAGLRRWPVPGIPSALLAGPPVDGGFGALPWREHSLARAAMWAWRLLCFLAKTPAASRPASPTATPPLWVPLVMDIDSSAHPSIQSSQYWRWEPPCGASPLASAIHVSYTFKYLSVQALYHPAASWGGLAWLGLAVPVSTDLS